MMQVDVVEVDDAAEIAVIVGDNSEVNLRSGRHGLYLLDVMLDHAVDVIGPRRTACDVGHVANREIDRLERPHVVCGGRTQGDTLSGDDRHRGC